MVVHEPFLTPGELRLNWSNVSFGRKDCGEGDEDRGTEGIALGAPEALPMVDLKAHQKLGNKSNCQGFSRRTIRLR